MTMASIFVDSDQGTYGGYNYQFVDIVSSDYNCSICDNVLRDAHLTECCGQHFCASCLTHWFTKQGKKTCPYCRQQDFVHIENKAMIRKVNELKIHCTNHRKGCGWVGELGGLKSHLNARRGCGYVVVTCTNKACREKMTRKDLQTHLQEKCYYRPYECEHCGHKDTYRAITGNKEYGKFSGHYSCCLEYPLACPNRCGATGIKRRAMPDHHSSCPLEPLHCPFNGAGCTGRVARKDMKDHMAANQQKHMLLTFQSQQKELHFLKDNIAREIDSLEKRIRQNTSSPGSIAQSLCRMKSILQGSLDKIGDMLTLRVTDFPQLMVEKKAWHSPPFSIADKVRVHLVVYPSGIGRGQGSHVSVSLTLIEVMKKEKSLWLQYNVSVAAVGMRRSASPKTLELCSVRVGDDGRENWKRPRCSLHFPFPSPGELLRSEEMFLERKEANSLLMNGSMTLEVTLLRHLHVCSSSSSDCDSDVTM